MYEWKADKEKQKALFGELWQFIEDDEVTDINYNCGNTWVKYTNYIPKRVDLESIDDEFMLNFSQRLGTMCGSAFNADVDTLEVDTADCRITCFHESRSVSGISVCIRKSLPSLRFTFEEAVGKKYASSEVMDFLINLVLAKVNFVFGGLPGEGKTEAVKFFSSYIPDHRTVVTIENARELHYKQINPNKSCIELKVGDEDLPKALSSVLRMNANCIIFAETRSREVRYLLECWSNGIPCITTMHVKDADDVPERIMNMLESRQGGQDIINEIYEHVGAAVLVKEEVLSDGRIHRYIKQVSLFERRSRENRIYEIVKDGVLHKENVPEDFRKKIEAELKRDIFSHYEKAEVS